MLVDTILSEETRARALELLAHYTPTNDRDLQTFLDAILTNLPTPEARRAAWDGFYDVVELRRAYEDAGSCAALGMVEEDGAPADDEAYEEQLAGDYVAMLTAATRDPEPKRCPGRPRRARRAIHRRRSARVAGR